MPDDAAHLAFGTPITARPDASASVSAEMLYLAPMGDKPFTFAYPPPEGTPWTNAIYESHRVTVRDARPLASGLSLDREGFAFAPHRSEVKDFSDEAELNTRAHAEAIALVRQVTGAGRVEVFDHTYRRNTPDVPDRAPGIPRQPVMRVHNDYTEGSGPQRVRDLMGDEADGLLTRRYAFINVWRPTRGPVLELPLAVCDAGSVAPRDFVASDLVYRDRRGEIYVATYNPAHRWFYFPRMQPDETILIKCYDSHRDVARFAPHGAFEDPTSPPDAPRRESLEIRTVAFFD